MAGRDSASAACRTDGDINNKPTGASPQG